MNRQKLILLLTAGLLSVATLVACNAGDKADETGTGTTAGTTAKTEAATAIPRYDYIDADVAGDVTLERSDYTDLHLTIPNSYRVTKEDVDAYIVQIRFENRIAVNGSTKVTDKALALGDDAAIYYKGFIDGKEFDGGSNWDDKDPYVLGLGSGAFIPGFEEALVGIVPNTTSKEAPAEIKVTFPEDYGEESLNGKEATFRVVVVHSVQYKMPDYTRKFLEETLKYEPKKEFYASDRALIDEFEEYVRETLVSKMASSLENAKIDALWTHLTETAICKNLPQMEVDYYKSAYTDELEYYYEYYAYSSAEFKTLYPDIASFAKVYMGLADGKDWKDEITDMAEKMVKKDMITHAIAEWEGLEAVTDEEYRDQIKYWVDYYGGQITESEVVSNMGETFLRESAFSEKMAEWLMEQCSFTYEDGTALDGETAGNEAETEASTDAATA